MWKYSDCFYIGKKGLCRGFGYVTFALTDDAEKAKTAVKTYGGRQLSICFADKKPKHEKRKRKQDGNHVNDGNDDNSGELVVHYITVHSCRDEQCRYCWESGKVQCSWLST